MGTIPARTLTAGETASVGVASYFSDPDGDPLTYGASTSSASVASVSVSGATLTIVGVAAGSATVTVTASDPDGLSAHQSAAVTVERTNQGPEAVGAIPDQTIAAGQTVTIDASLYFSDPDGDVLTYDATTSSIAVAVASVSGSTLTIGGVGPGTATMTVTASDPDDLSAHQSAAVTVESANQGPEPVGAIPNQTITAGQTVTIDAAQYFNDPDGNPLTYAATTTNVPIAAVSMSGSILTIAGIAPGSATVTVTASDPDGLSAHQSAAVTVERTNQGPEAVGAIPDQTIAAGQTVTIDATQYFNDPDGNPLTYAATTTNVPIAAVSMSGSILTIAGIAPGSATVTVTASDPDGLSAHQSAAVTVERTNQGPEAVGAIPDQTIAAGQTVTIDASLYFSDPDGDVLTYDATTSSIAVAVASVSGSSVTIGAVAAGTTTVTVTASDPSGLSATQRISVTVTEGNQAPVPVGTIPPLTLTEGETARVRVDRFFSDPDRDRLVYTAESSDVNVVSVSFLSSILMTVKGLMGGAATVTVTASDPGGLTATQSISVTVQANQAPVVVATIPTQNMTAGETVTLHGSQYFADPDGDALTYEAESSNSGLVTVSVSSGTVTVKAVAEGSATVTVAAVDPRLLKAEQSFSVTVMANPDRAVLVALYQSTGGPNWRSNRRWLTDAPLRDWSGVSVNADGRVVELHLPCNRLKGPIPTELGNLTYLRSIGFGPCIDYDPNELTGRIPPELGSLSNLNTLNLASNELTGRIPPELGSLSNLNTLALRSNDLTGPIPPELGNLSNLSDLDFGRNGLTGPIPPELGNLASLSTLTLNSNDLTGPIPPELGDLSNLTYLSLSFNALTSPIPPELGNLSSLSTLNLGSNGLTGPIPPELGNLSGLSSLDLDYNALTGPIPPELGKLTSLINLFLNDNGLEGPIPPELGELISLINLYLNNNKLTGTIPESFLQLTPTYFKFAGNEGLCFPNTDSFAAWLATIRFHDTIRLCS